MLCAKLGEGGLAGNFYIIPNKRVVLRWSVSHTLLNHLWYRLRTVIPNTILKGTMCKLKVWNDQIELTLFHKIKNTFNVCFKNHAKKQHVYILYINTDIQIYISVYVCSSRVNDEAYLFVR